MFIFEKTTWKWSLIWMKFRLMNNSSMILPSTKNEAASNLLTCCFSIISIFFFVCLFLWNCFECGYEFLQDCRVNNGEQNAKNRKILSAIVSKRQASKCQGVIFFPGAPYLKNPNPKILEKGYLLWDFISHYLKYVLICLILSRIVWGNRVILPYPHV